MKRLVVGMLLCTAARAFADVDNSPPPTFKVAMGGQYMPLHGSERGKPMGLEYELAKRISRGLLKVIDPRKQLGKSALEAVQSGDVDVGINAITVTPEREALVSFSEPYLIVPFRLASAGAAVTEFASLEGTVAGSDVALKALQGVAPKAKLRPVASTGEALKLVLAKQADFVADDEIGLTLTVKGTVAQLVGPGFGEAAFAVAGSKGSGNWQSDKLRSWWPEIERIKKDLGLQYPIELLAHARAGRLERVKAMLDNGMPATATDASGRNILRAALGGGSLPVTMLALSRGLTVKLAELSPPEQEFAAKVFCRAAVSDAAALKQLIDLGLAAARGPCEDTYGGAGPVLAVLKDWSTLSFRFEERCKLALQLVEAGTDLKAATRWGVTPLHRLADTCPGAVAPALKKGAAVDARDSEGRTPLVYAIRNKQVDSIKALAAGGADLNAATGKEEKTPLALAVWDRNLDVVRALLDAGAKVDARNTQGQTPLDLAYKYQLPEIAKLLESRGAKRAAAGP